MYLEGINNTFQGLENFKSARQSERAPKNTEKKTTAMIQVAPDDPYMKWPLRGLAYSNEIGEIIRPMSSMCANLLWIPAIGYIAADVGDKYRHSPDGKEEPSKKRATKQLAFQTFASVLLPTAAVKLGQKIANVVSAKGDTKLTINDRQMITQNIVESLDKGSHEAFVDAKTGLVDRAKYTEHIVNNLASKEKHAKTGSKLLKPFDKVFEFLKRPFEKKPKTEAIQGYVSKTVDKIMDMRDTLLSGNKPKGVSNKLFRTFETELRGADLTQQKSAAFNIIKKVQGNKMFKNNALKSLGGLIALAIMMKPIDTFVEKVLIEKMVEPTINVLGSLKFWKSLGQIAKEANDEAEAKKKLAA